MKYWLLKTEPETFSIDQLMKEGKTNWNGVRNYQARNFLREMKVGDLAVIYHSGDERAAVGTAKVSKAAYPDPDPKKPGDWVQIDIVADRKFTRSVPLSEMKSDKALAGLLLFKQSRLSCMPVEKAHFDHILNRSKKGAE